MGGDQKLTSAEELHALFSDPARLQTYRYTQPVVSDCGIDNEKFHLELPYDAIRAKVEECRDAFLAAVPEQERSGLVWEHVGSTSIRGMPGTMMPDSLLIGQKFNNGLYPYRGISIKLSHFQCPSSPPRSP